MCLAKPEDDTRARTILKAGAWDSSCQICIQKVQQDPWLSFQKQLEQRAQQEHAAQPEKLGWICF